MRHITIFEDAYFGVLYIFQRDHEGKMTRKADILYPVPSQQCSYSKSLKVMAAARNHGFEE
jgi:hypothetical protein